MEKEVFNDNVNKGKAIMASIKQNKNSIKTFNIGTLNQIKDLYSYLKSNINNFGDIKTIKIEGKDYKNQQNNIFSSIGIINDFLNVILNIIMIVAICSCIILKLNKFI